MTEPDYEYSGFLASTWDLLRGDTSHWSDKFFYRDLIEEYGQPVLDMGCGTGRLILDYLQDGLDVDGVDNSPEMLALCREKARRLGLEPALYEQWMHTLDLPRRYRTILVPSSSFQLLPDPAEAAHAMQRFYAHLEHGGALVMPFMLFWQEGQPVETDWELTAEAVRPEDGALIRRWSRDTFDVENQVVTVSEERYEATLDGATIASDLRRRSPSGRWYTQAQAIRLYREAGFDQIQAWSGFTRRPAQEQDALFTMVGVK